MFNNEKKLVNHNNFINIEIIIISFKINFFKLSMILQLEILIILIRQDNCDLLPKILLECFTYLYTFQILISHQLIIQEITYDTL